MRTASGRLWNRSPFPWIPIVVLGTAVFFSARLLIIVDRYAAELLYWDQWDVLEDFFHGDPSISGLFLFQFGPHREGVG